MAHRVNIEDVAREAGVHRSTVSRALTGSGPVSAANRERVLQAARKLDYHPNTVAGALKSRRRNTWGLLSFWYFTPSSLDHYYAKVLGGLLDTAGKAEHRVLLQNVVGRFDQSESCRRFCHESQLGGLLILAPRTEEAALKDLRKQRVPTVLVAYRPRDRELSFIDLDNVHASRVLVEHLVHEGHRRIGFIGGELKLSANARDRHDGYLAAMDRCGLALDARVDLNRDFTPGFAVQAFDAMWALPRTARPTAIVCATDRMAAAVGDAARAAGLRIPEDLALCGIDDDPIAAPAEITTVRFPFYEVGAQAGEMLRTLSEGLRDGPLQVLLPPQIIVRRSTSGNAR
ncbi:MAG: LacI family DNA-binding transcriptional regulator [Polyangiaceae bacterium]|nr:LacI family DNA-binding transcriptional regulator [Polyangiaceae bacterium]